MPSSNDLTSLADCKAWLGVTSTADDTLLAGLITSISQAILADLGRPSILPQSYVETLDGDTACVLALRHWPAAALIACTIDGATVPISSGPGQTGLVLETADTAPPGVMQRLAYRGGTFSCGIQNVCVTYRAGYEVLGETAAVPAAAPFIVTALAPYGAWQQDTGVVGASASYVAANGLYTFGTADAGATVALNYAFVPAALARAACEWVADRYVARTRIGQSAKTLGGQETTSFIVKAMPDVVDRLLQPYRRVAR
jgi:hypothetical protein